MKKIFSIIILCMGMVSYGVAQDSTASEEKEVPKQKFTRATFNATKLINMQTTEIVSQGSLQFMISHHFSYLWNKDADAGQNLAQVLGLNSGVAHTYLSFDYSPTQWLNLGVALAGSSKFEGWAKFKLLRQQTGVKNVPVSVALFSLAGINAAKQPDVSTANKMAFMNQLLIARKFSDKLSLQLMPTWVHYNVVPYGYNNSNEIFSIGLGGKYKVKSNLNLTFEYSRQLNMYENIIDKNGNILNYKPDLVSLGVEINTGGHLFQFYVGNTTDASNITQLSKNTSSIKDGNFAFGFTINRSLSLKK